jgi:hypothetical protein
MIEIKGLTKNKQIKFSINNGVNLFISLTASINYIDEKSFFYLDNDIKNIKTPQNLKVNKYQIEECQKIILMYQQYIKKCIEQGLIENRAYSLIELKECISKINELENSLLEQKQNNFFEIKQKNSEHLLRLSENKKNDFIHQKTFDFNQQSENEEFDSIHQKTFDFNQQLENKELLTEIIKNKILKVLTNYNITSIIIKFNNGYNDIYARTDEKDILIEEQFDIEDAFLIRKQILNFISKNNYNNMYPTINYYAIFLVFLLGIIYVKIT